MTHPHKFPNDIKNSIFQIINRVCEDYSTEEGQKELFENRYSFIGEDDAIIQPILDFVNQQEINSIATRNINFCYPSVINLPGGVVSVGVSLQGSGGDLLDIFEDFILYTSRILLGEDDREKKLELAWEKFEKDFFADEIEVTFIAQVADFYYHAGGILEDMVPRDDVKIRYLHTDNKADKALYFSTRNNITGSFRAVDPEEFTKTIPIIVEYVKKINKNEKVESYFSEARDIFEKVCFLLRIICGGSAHFDFIRPVFFGNYTSDRPLLQNYPTNHLFTNSPDSTTMDSGPYQTWFERAWEGIDGRDMQEWQFVNLKLRDSYSRALRDDPHMYYDQEYRLSRQLEKLIDLIQALENVLGDYGRFNGEYAAELTGGTDTARKIEIKDKIEALYKIRDKYLHGRPTGRDSLESTFQAKFHGNIDELESAIHTLDYNLRKVILLSIMNSDFSQKMKEYHTALGRPVVSVIRGKAQPTSFPQFRTIYY